MTWTETQHLSVRHANYLIKLLNEDAEPEKPKHAADLAPLPEGLKRTPVMT